MATPFTDALDRIVAQFQAVFTRPEILRREERPDIALLEMRGDYGSYLIYLREIRRADGSRKYAYYAVEQGQVSAGFDNAPDPRALRLKYGPAYPQHRLEPVAHRHTAAKQTLELTPEMDCAAFIAWLQANLPLPPPLAVETQP